MCYNKLKKGNTIHIVSVFSVEINQANILSVLCFTDIARFLINCFISYNIILFTFMTLYWFSTCADKQFPDLMGLHEAHLLPQYIFSWL